MKFILLSLSFLFAHQAYSQTTEFKKVVDFYAKEKNFNGALLVASHGNVEFLTGLGVANRQDGTQIKADTKFKIASVTKTFTTVLIMQLYEAGKLDLNAMIGTYLPNYKGEGRDKVTIDQLLTYSSGIPDCEGTTGMAVYQEAISTEGFMDKYCSGNLSSEPGTKFSYNNSHFIILGKIIEHITGKSFAQNLKEMILDPLGMKNTGMVVSENIISGLVPTYSYNDTTKVFYNDVPYFIENFYAAAAMYSTVEDLLKFDRAIFEAKLVEQQTLDLMLTSHPKLNYVAYGFWVWTPSFGSLKTKAANRQGSVLGANANWLHLIGQGKTFIVLSNTDATNLSELTEQLVLISTGQRPTYQSGKK